MKILFSLGSLNRGGAETLLLDVLSNIISLGDDEIICLYRKSGVLEKEFIRTGVKLLKIEAGWSKLNYILKLRKIIKNEDIDVIHSHQPLDAFYSIISSVGLRTKKILTLHGSGLHQNFLTRIMYFFVFRLSDNILFVSKFQKKQFINKYPQIEQKVKVLNNGINFTKITDFKDKSIREELNILDSTIIISSVGNFIPGREHLTLCKFANLLTSNSIDYKLLLVGKRVSEYKERFDKCVHYCEQHGIEDKVLFLGSRSDVPSILFQTDAFIYSSEHDTFGIAVVEAIASGIPVFVNDWEVMNEITEEGKLAVIYKTKDENDLLEKFMLFLQQRDEYVRKAKESAEIVREKYSIQKHIDNLKKVYSSLHYKK